MGHYDALGPEIRKAVDELRRSEEGWRLQETKALEALQWCEILNDREGMNRLCAIFERTGGMESPAIHQNLKRIFNDMAAPDTQRLQALTCLNNTDWSKATDAFIFITPARDDGPDFPLTIDELIKGAQSNDRDMQHQTAQTLMTLGAHPAYAKAALEVLKTVADNAALSFDIRRDAQRHAETLHTAQHNRMQALVIGLEKDTYYPRPRMG